jgi:putative ABC transport system permease protein
VNLALRDVRRHLGRFMGTAAGLGLLLSVVVAMQGIYAGMVDDATILTRAMHADLWLVQRDTRGPFAEGSRLDPSVEARAAAVPGVRSARPYTYQLIQREHRGAVMRIALVGLGWPDDPGRTPLPLVRWRPAAATARRDDRGRLAWAGHRGVARARRRAVPRGRAHEATRSPPGATRSPS